MEVPMRIPRLRSWSAVGAAASLVLAACGGGSGGGGGDLGGGGGGGGGGTAGNTLRVYVTDAPFPFDYVESATVVIREVRVHQAGEGDDDSGWTTVFTGSEEIDLVPLTGGVEQLLVESSPAPTTRSA
jgi:hypothetical protein